MSVMLLTMPNRGEVVAKLLKERGRNPNWLAKEVGFKSPQSAYDLISGVEPRDPSVWKRVAHALGVPENTFTEVGTAPERPNVKIEPQRPAVPNIVLLPFWGNVPCGDWMQPTADPEWIQVSDRIAEEFPTLEGLVAVRIAGESLAPRLTDGQLVTVRLSPQKIDGVITLFRNQDNELTMKLMRKTPVGWELESINPQYPTVSADEVTIIGHAVNLEEFNRYGLRA